MARAVVVYESMFGNTRAVAEAVATGLRDRLQVDVVEVSAAPDRVAGDDGAPSAVALTDRGLREWLEHLQYAQGVGNRRFRHAPEEGIAAQLGRPCRAQAAAAPRLPRRGGTAVVLGRGDAGTLARRGA